MSFLYYIPDGKGPAAIAYAHELPLLHAKVTRGPCGLPDAGTIYAARESMEISQVGLYEDKQHWCKFKDFCLGWYKNSPPSPASLQRLDQIDSRPVELGDGNQWMIPVARQWHEGDPIKYSTRLPRHFELNESDEEWMISLDPMKKYMRLWELAGKYFDHDANVDGEGLTFEDTLDIAVECLATNYRVGKREVSALQLLTTSNCLVICDILIDREGFAELIKKKLAFAASSTGNGQQEEPLVTLQPSLT